MIWKISWKKLLQQAVKTKRILKRRLRKAELSVQKHFIAEHQENIKELTTLFKNAVETGIGVIATVHSSKPKGFDELNKWFKTSSNGLVIGSQGTSNVYPMISAKDMPMTGDGLLDVNSVYERLLLPLYE